ncbi:hypothetical protein F5B22DRAFT_640458 [Xylaria bambusicola]|uniref:uncharacterized protein n=1 Tax=Xylaria bambusicola TaxID=326684 RepID=UPI00200812A9|nr:uncharacterized protein F5B22DRAFT_640458 [Xylaria bambusicola]KAI0503031.1 hypothetical protein F5B22DRAFT_640458 [Xylaria bambusicola]
MSAPLICGLCGVDSRRISPDHNPWSRYYRAIYCVGLESQEPQLSGLTFHRRGDEIEYLPPKAYQRFDDEGLDPLSLITIRGFRPPGALELQEDASYAWGFRFHDSCWKLVEQASAPDPVNLKLLWRILLSVPHTATLPLWGHNFGGLYLGSRRDYPRGNNFVIIGSSSSLIIPSAYRDPLEVPELTTRLAQQRIKTGDTASLNAKPICLTASSTRSLDPFSVLPVELREIILTYVATEDILSFRLSSRVIAATRLSQYFFQSRFWARRELDFFFDAFLLSPAEKAGIDWRELYRSSKARIKYNMVGLGERNRLRIWKQTVRPLTQAIHEITRLSELKGKSESDWPQELADGAQATWTSIETSQCLDPELVGDITRQLYRAEIELPSSKIEAIHVSLIDFFGVKYISGLAFETEHGEDIELGYIMPGSEEPLLVEASLEGFHVAVDYCGFKAISPYTSQHMQSEYLDWVGDKEDLPVRTLRCSEGAVRRIRATFDGFRMQSLHLP